MSPRSSADSAAEKARILSIISARKDLLALIVLSIAIRIPRVPGILGDDAFVVLWMGHVLSEGYFTIWTLSPLSLIGLYPFSDYPIGVPLFIAAMMKLGLSFEAIVLIISMTTNIIGTVGAYYLGTVLFEDRQKALFFTMFYTFSFVFVISTYYTATARGPFLGILPWFLFYGVKLFKGSDVSYWKLTDEGLVHVTENNLRQAIYALFFFVLLVFTHGLAIFTLAYGAVVIGYYFLKRLKNSDIFKRITETLRRRPLLSSSTSVHRSSNHEHTSFTRGSHSTKATGTRIPDDWLSWLAFLTVSIGALLLGLIVIPIDPAKTAPFFLSNDTLVGVAWNLVVDYGIRLGLMSVFLPIGILGAFHKDRESDRRLIHFLLVPMILFTLPKSTYAAVLFLPVFGYYSVIGFDLSRMLFRDRWIGFSSVVFVLVFSVTYVLFVVTLPPWLVLFIVLSFTVAVLAVFQGLRRWRSYHTTVGRQLRRWMALTGQGPIYNLDRQGLRILLISVIVISLVTTEGVTLQGVNHYLSHDEYRIIEFLGGQPTTGIVFVPTPVVGRRLQAYGFKAILAFNGGAALYFGWIQPTDITSNCHLSIGGILRNGKPYTYEGTDPERVIWNALFNLDLTAETDRELAKEIGLEFVIVEKTASGYSNEFHSIYGTYPSMLLSSAPLICELVVDGERMCLFSLPS
ncbi:MAG: hypothetical protein ACFFEU_06420 [Candidatus Thorarchaeota archaeon]